MNESALNTPPKATISKVWNDTNELRDVEKEKKKKEEQWAASLGFGDVVFDKQLTKIESIGGVPFETWKVKMSRHKLWKQIHCLSIKCRSTISLY